MRDILGQDFYLNDDQRTRFANLRDVFAHRIGVPRHDDLRLAGYDLQEFVGLVKELSITVREHSEVSSTTLSCLYEYVITFLL